MIGSPDLKGGGGGVGKSGVSFGSSVFVVREAFLLDRLCC